MTATESKNQSGSASRCLPLILTLQHMCRHRAFVSRVLFLLITLQARYVSGLDRNLIPGQSCNREILRFGSESVRRQLLDTEKIIFYTDNLATYQGQEHIVEIQAEATGIHRDGPAAKPKFFLYNIVLAELVLGVPRDAFPVIVMVFFAVVVVALLLPWWVDHAVPAMLSFINAGRSTTHTAHAA